MAHPGTTTGSAPPRTLGILLILLGTLLTAGGVWLMTRGDSPYFLAVGVGVAVTGLLLARGSRSALVVYAVTLGVIIVGTFLEEGANIGKLVPRLAVPLT